MSETNFFWKWTQEATLALSKVRRLFKIVRCDNIKTKYRKFWKDTEFLASWEIGYSEGKEKPFYNLFKSRSVTQKVFVILVENQILVLYKYNIW